jgi:hypothetical protein
MSWTKLTGNANFPADETSNIVVNNGTKLVKIGGHNNNFHNYVWESNNGEIWIQKKVDTEGNDPWCYRRSHAVVYFQDKYWLFGGCTELGTLASDIWYSTDGYNWDCFAGSSSLGRRAGHTIVKISESQILIIGGYCCNAEKTQYWDADDVWSFNGTTLTRLVEHASWGGRRNHMSAKDQDGKIWVIGGNYGVGTYYLRDDAYYSTDGGYNWAQASSNSIYERARSGLVVYNDNMYLIGGVIQNTMEWKEPDCSEDNVDNDVYVWNGSSWSQLGDIPWGKRASLSAVVFDGKLLIIAGSVSQNNMWYNDIWAYEE